MEVLVFGTSLISLSSKNQFYLELESNKKGMPKCQITQ